MRDFLKICMIPTSSLNYYFKLRYVFSFLQNWGHNVRTVYNLCFLASILWARKLVVFIPSGIVQDPLTPSESSRTNSFNGVLVLILF